MEDQLEWYTNCVEIYIPKGSEGVNRLKTGGRPKHRKGPKRTEKDRKGPKRTEKDRKGTEKDRKGTEKDRKGRTSLLFTEKEAKSRR